MSDLSFSIVIPTHARPQRLARALDAIVQLDWPPGDVEVIIVNDGSPQGYESVERCFAERPNVKWVWQEQQGPAAARNRGAQDAGGNFLVFTDDDCRPEPGWLRAFARAFDPAPAALLGGVVRNGLPDNPYSAAAQQLSNFFCDYQNRRDGAPAFFTSNNIAMRRAEFLALGGFDAGFGLPAGEDRELCRRWARSGYPLHQVQDAIVRHEHELDLAGFWKQNYSYGRGAALFHRASPRRASSSMLPESADFYFALIASPLRAGKAAEQWGQAGLICLSQFAVATGFAHESVRRLFGRGSTGSNST